MEIRLTYRGSTFAFSRDWAGNGAWYCVSGRCPGLIGSANHMGITVPLVYASELTKEAVNQGIATHKDLARTIKKEKKKSVRVKGSSSRKVLPKLKGSFNPFKRAVSATGEVTDADETIEKLKSEGAKRPRRKLTDDEETTSFFSDLFQPDDDDTEEVEETGPIEYEEISSEVIG